MKESEARSIKPTVAGTRREAQCLLMIGVLANHNHRRSLAETTMFRFKTIFGDRVQTRRIENQFKELLLKTAILNQMTHLGIPDSYYING